MTMSRGLAAVHEGGAQLGLLRSTDTSLHNDCPCKGGGKALLGVGGYSLCIRLTVPRRHPEAPAAPLEANSWAEEGPIPGTTQSPSTQ